MGQPTLPELINRAVALSGGNMQHAADRLGVSAASLSRWRSGRSRPRHQQEARLRALVEGPGDLFAAAPQLSPEGRLSALEDAASGTIHALREEFHRSAAVSTRQEALDVVAALFFAHVASIDNGARGIGEHLCRDGQGAAQALNSYVSDAFARYLPVRGNADKNDEPAGTERFFLPLRKGGERFARQLLRIFERDAAAFRELHEAGRDDLINEIFSRFMSTSFVDEKEMGQYLTPPEIVRFMVEVGLHALTPEARGRLLAADQPEAAGVVLDPSCGVGSFLAEVVRHCHGVVRGSWDAPTTRRWLTHFAGHCVAGIDKSERMLRLAMINLGLFGIEKANLSLANALARSGPDGELCGKLEGKVELILTNPPFGASYTDEELRGFAMGRGRSRAESEVLFLERYVDWLMPGGVVATVVPDSVLANRNAFAELRRWLGARCGVEAVFSLPPVTFGAAGTNTKTSVLVLRKDARAHALGPTYFAEARDVGFDVVTRSGQRRRIRTDRTDLPSLLAGYRGDVSGEIGRRRPLGTSESRWDATFHTGLPDEISALVEQPESALVRVSSVARLVEDRIDPRRQGSDEFDYVEISDVDTRTGLVSAKRVASASAPSRARKPIRAGDVLVSTVRPERGAVGLTPTRLDGAICSTGFAVLRCPAIHPLALVWLLKTDFVRHQMTRNNIGVSYPAISEESCMDLVLPATTQGLASLSVAAAALAAAQERLDAAQETFTAHVSSVCRAATGTTRP